MVSRSVDWAETPAAFVTVYVMFAVQPMLAGSVTAVEVFPASFAIHAPDWPLIGHDAPVQRYEELYVVPFVEDHRFVWVVFGGSVTFCPAYPSMVRLAVGAPEAVNVAVHDFAELIVTEPSAQSASPLHPKKLAPPLGVAVRFTTVPVLYVALHVPLEQLMPAGFEVTVPAPVPALVTARLYVTGAAGQLSVFGEPLSSAFEPVPPMFIPYALICLLVPSLRLAGVATENP
jgi:hypothetical protein